MQSEDMMSQSMYVSQFAVLYISFALFQSNLTISRHTQKDCVQWVMENSPKTKPWSVKRVVHELIALWFGSVHITSTVSKHVTSTTFLFSNLTVI